PPGRDRAPIDDRWMADHKISIKPNCRAGQESNPANNSCFGQTNSLAGVVMNFRGRREAAFQHHAELSRPRRLSSASVADQEETSRQGQKQKAQSPMVAEQ